MDGAGRVNGGSEGQHLPSACSTAALAPTVPVWLLWETINLHVKGHAGQEPLLQRAQAWMCVMCSFALAVP